MRGTPQDFGDQPAVGCRARSGSPSRHRDVSAGDRPKVDLGDLNGAGRKRDGLGFDAWATVTGIRFRSVGGGADIGSIARMEFPSDGEIARAEADVPQSLTAWGTGIGGATAATDLHEIGHAPGLGNPDDHDEVAAPSDRLHGTALTSALSRFGSDMSEEVDHGVARPVAPMPADVIAVRGPHGSTPINGGDTVHGPGGDADGPFGPVLAALAGRAWEPTRRSPTAIEGRNTRSTGT